MHYAYIGGGNRICKCSIEIFSGSTKTYSRRRICTTHIIGGGSPIAITVGNSWQADSVTPSLGYDCNIVQKEVQKIYMMKCKVIFTDT